MVYDNAPTDNLRDLLSQRSQVVSFDNVTHSFFPKGSFDDLFTSETVYTELWPRNEKSSAEAGLSDVRSRKLLVTFILEKSKTTFAILLTFVKSGRELRQTIHHFINAGLDDSKLPITSKDIRSQVVCEPGNNSKYREPWSRFGEQHFFDDWQWRFTAPVFHHGRRFWGLPQKTILPFTKVNSRGADYSGKFGDVHEVTIHPAHIGSILPANRSVSIKKLYRPQTDDPAKLQDLEKAWRQEVYAHEELVKCGHRNIIKFIAGITKGNDRYLMCEWANGGNLREFWATNEKPHLTRTLIRDVIVQFQGISGALNLIHGRGFRHGDMKPENIVRQENLPQDSGLSKLDVGELKICDLGSTKYHVEATEFRNLSTDTRFVTRRYEPPESLPVVRHQPWSRRYDIWSIGCIILEFIVWMLEGSRGLKDFNDTIVDDFGRGGQYFEWEKSGDGQIVFYVHTAVKEKMRSLSSLTVCRARETALGDLLKIVETRLLVVDLTSTDHKLPTRADSESLKKEVDNIVERGTRNPAYWLQGETREDIPILHPATAIAPSTSQNTNSSKDFDEVQPEEPFDGLKMELTEERMGEWMKEMKKEPKKKPLRRWRKEVEAEVMGKLTDEQATEEEPTDNPIDEQIDEPIETHRTTTNDQCDPDSGSESGSDSGSDSSSESALSSTQSSTHSSIETSPSSVQTEPVQPQDNKEHDDLSSQQNRSSSLAKDEKNAQQQQAEDDKRSVYSIDSTRVDDRMRTYILEFANAVIKELFSGSTDDDTIGLLHERLPDAIRAFALRIGGRSSTQAQRDIMYFTHKHRRLITQQIRNILEEVVPDGSASPEDEQTPLPSVHISVPNWLNLAPDSEQTENTPIDDQQALSEPDVDELEPMDKDETHMLLEPDDDEPEPDFSEIRMYTGIISSNVAYRWLINNLKRDIGLKTFDDSATTQISKKVLSCLEGPRRISRRRPSVTKIVTFMIEWNPKDFLSAQFSSEALIGHTISDTITLTGSSQDAFAASCRDYLNLMWPNTGKCMATFIDNISSKAAGSSFSYDLEDGSHVTGMINNSELQVRIDGGIYTIVEMAEQLGWLASALKNSPYGSGMAGCMPEVSHLRQLSKGPESDKPQSKEYSCRLDFSVSRARDSTSEQEGECWHNLFRNPTIAMTYPIPRREIGALGLEIPLDMMAALIQAKEVQRFKETLFLKGFSAMLTPTWSIGNELLWHLNFNEKGDRISYLDVAHQCLRNISIGSVESSRHFVGWCSRVRYLAGSAEAKYTIERSGLREPGSGCVLEKIAVTGGKIISVGATFAIATKDQPVHLKNRDNYYDCLDWISKKHVVLWDEKDKRGWLVNGSSALLYLARASLEINKTGKLKKVFRLKSGLKKIDSTPHIAGSAMDELLDKRNMHLELYPSEVERPEEETTEAGKSKTVTNDKPSGFVFRDRVKHIYSTLEKLMDYQVEASKQNGVKLNLHMHRQLEGWDFKDIASDRDPFHPRVASLHSILSTGTSWVDLVKGINAITLLGCGFGDLLDPVTRTNLCSYCALVPKDCYYLTAAVSDLKDIMEDHGDSKSQPPQLCQSVYWHQNQANFGKCRGGSEKHRDLAQVLTSSKTTALDWIRSFRSAGTSSSTCSSPSIPQEGAVIFGHKSFMEQFSPNHGKPSVSEEPYSRTPKDAVSEADNTLHTDQDSGLGSSNSAASDSQSYSRARSPDGHSITNNRDPLSELQGSSTSNLEAPRRRPDDLHQPLSSRTIENAWELDEQNRQARHFYFFCLFLIIIYLF